MKTVKNILKGLTLIAVVLLITTSKIGTVVNEHYVEFKDGTGYYHEEAIKGSHKVYPFLTLVDMFN